MALTSLTTIKNWFKTNLIPTQQQFYDMFDSFRHKGDKVAATDIDGLTTLLAAKANTEAFTSHTAAENAHAGLFGALRTWVGEQIAGFVVGSTLIDGVTLTSALPETGNIHTIVAAPGTYVNWNNLVVPVNSIAVLMRVDGVYSVTQTVFDITSKVNVSDIVDGLESSETEKPASANSVRLTNEKFIDYAKTTDVDIIIGNPILTNYVKDFSLLTTAVNAPSLIWINDQPTTTSGKISSIRVKAPIGSVINAYVYEITGSEGSYIYNQLHAFAPFTTTTLTHTQTITDAFEVEAGQFIGFKSSLGIYYVETGKGYHTLSPSSNNQNYSIDFVINENISDGILGVINDLEVLVTTNQTDILDVRTVVGKEPILTQYSKDFAPITDFVNSASAIWINKVDLTTRGKLTQLRVKAPIGSLITPYIYTVSGSEGSLSFVQNHIFTPFTTSSETHTESITDEYVLEVGQLIGYKSSLGIYYKPGTALKSYTVGLTSSDAHTFAYDYVINENTTFGLVDRVTALEEDTVQETNVILKPVILYRNNLSSLTDFTAVNWSVSGGVAVPSATGEVNHLWLQKEYHVTPRKMSIDIVLLSDSVFDVQCKGFEYANGSGYYSIDVPNNSLKIYDSSRALVSTSVIGFALVTGRKYTISLSIIDWLNIFEIKDAVNSNVHTFEYQIETSELYLEPKQNESYRFYLYSGTTTGVKLSNFIISSKKNPLIYLSGDSITEGALLSTANFNKRYGIMLREKLKGNVLISARGGAIGFDVALKKNTEQLIIKPDYTMLTIGTNGGLTSGNLTDIVNDIIASGSIPIVNHVPANNAYSDYQTTNTTIDSVCLATGAIRGCLFDVATASSNVPANGYNSALFNSDGIHPNALGNAEMFKRFEIDLPFLFI